MTEIEFLIKGTEYKSTHALQHVTTHCNILQLQVLHVHTAHRDLSISSKGTDNSIKRNRVFHEATKYSIKGTKLHPQPPPHPHTPPLQNHLSRRAVYLHFCLPLKTDLHIRKETYTTGVQTRIEINAQDRLTIGFCPPLKRDLYIRKETNKRDLQKRESLLVSFRACRPRPASLPAHSCK